MTMKYYRFLLISTLALLLSGCAGVFIAGAATAVYVVTDPRSSSELAADQKISLEVAALGNKAPYQFNIRVNSSTFRGSVLLMGQAVSQQYKDKVENDVRKIKGVTTVYNQMKVKPLLSFGAISKDTWITTKVKSALIAEKELSDIKISVFTEDTEVFLTGSVSPHHANIAVEVARNISGVTRVIKAFYYGENEAAKESGSEKKKEIQVDEIIHTPSQSTNQTVSPTETVPFIEPVEVKEEDL